MAGFDGRFTRIARSFPTAAEATKALNIAFISKGENVWVDRFGQEFTLIENIIEVQL